MIVPVTPIVTKTRMAPTPSGFLHVGNVYSFALTAALAQKTGAGILLRMDDLDRERVNRSYVQDIFDTLHFLNIPFTEGPRSVDEFEAQYSQQHRLPAYNAALERLRAQNNVYACNCSRLQILNTNAQGIYPGTCRHKNIPLDAPDVCWRLRTDEPQVLNVKTIHGSIIKETLPADMHDVVVRRKNGLPAYQLSSVIDDVTYGIDLLVRGNDLWPSTLAQLYLAGRLGLNAFSDSIFYHHPLLLTTDAQKLSKSAGHTSVNYLRKHHASPADIYGQIKKQLNLKGRIESWQDFAAFI